MEKDKYRPPSIEEAPWLIITHDNRRKLEKQTFYTTSSDNKSCIRTIPELDGNLILSSCLGWLILQKRGNTTMYSIWNPVTLQFIRLPELIDAPDDGSPTCVLTSSPEYDSHGECSSVLLLFFPCGFVFLCKPTTRDDCRWIKQSVEYADTRVAITKAITLNGDVYAYTETPETGGCMTSFARLKLTNDCSNTLLFEPNLIERPSKSLDCLVYPFSLDYLLEVDGVLYAVNVMIREMNGDNLENLEIFKAVVLRLDLSRMKWIRLNSLGDRAFLLGDGCCTWCWAGASRPTKLGFPITRNCIYLVRLGSPTVYLYRLRDDSYTCFRLPHPFLPPSNGPTWFVSHNHMRFSPTQGRKLEKTGKMRYVTDSKKENLELSSDILSRLPEDMLIRVPERLHLFDYMNLPATCNTFRSKFTRPKWRDGCPRPFFLSLKNNKGICELRDPYRTTSHIIRTPVYPNITTIEFCNNGWLLFRTEGICLEYYNPFTHENGDYPYSYMMPSNASYGFSTCPNSPGCLTVGIQAWGGDVSIDIFQHGNKEWDNHVFSDIIGFRANNNSSPKYYNEAFYFMGNEGRIGVLKMIEGKWSWKVYHGPEEVRSSLNSCYLVEVNKELICIFIQQLGKRVQIFKFDIAEECWVKLNNLGDHVVFLSAASTYSILEKDTTISNRVYLSKRVNNRLVYYSLCTGKYHISSKDAPMDDFYGMNGQSFCCWV